MTASTWALVSGEYPPQKGGVADYTKQLATALEAAGDSVRVFAPHASPLSELATLEPGRRLLVQWVPHAYGWKGMNVPLALWLSRQRGLEVIFHEVAFPRGTGFKGDIVSAVTSFMAARLGRAARRVFVTIPAWSDRLRELGVTREPFWLPVPSNVPLDVDPEAVRALRTRLAPRAPLVGHFGTYGPKIVALLGPALRALSGTTRFLLAGRGGPAFATEHGIPADRTVATGELEPRDVARHLAACDVVFQPYPDGASARRTSLMTPLGLGIAVVTNEGFLSEPVWRESGAVALAEPTPAGFAARIDRLLGDAAERARLAERARTLYRERFAIEHVVRVLREAA